MRVLGWFVLLSAALTACPPAPVNDAGADAGTCPAIPVHQNESCVGMPSGLRCASELAAGCDGVFTRNYCNCTNGTWQCDIQPCDAGTDAARD